MLNKGESNTIFWVFSMMQPGIELQSPGLLANTNHYTNVIYIYIYIYDWESNFRAPCTREELPLE